MKTNFLFVDAEYERLCQIAEGSYKVSLFDIAQMDNQKEYDTAQELEAYYTTRMEQDGVKHYD